MAFIRRTNPKTADLLSYMLDDKALNRCIEESNREVNTRKGAVQSTLHQLYRKELADQGYKHQYQTFSKYAPKSDQAAVKNLPDRKYIEELRSNGIPFLSLPSD